MNYKKSSKLFFFIDTSPISVTKKPIANAIRIAVTHVLYRTRLSVFWGTFSVSERTQRRLQTKVSDLHIYHGNHH